MGKQDKQLAEAKVRTIGHDRLPAARPIPVSHARKLHLTACPPSAPLLSSHHAAAACRLPPAASRQPPAASRQLLLPHPLLALLMRFRLPTLIAAHASGCVRQLHHHANQECGVWSAGRQE